MERLHTLTFRPQDAVVRVPTGTTVFEAASWAGVTIDSTCGGRGTCGKCRVRVLGGEIPPTETDRRKLTPAEIADGWRLACRSRLSGDGEALEFAVPELATRPKAALLGHGRHVVLAPSVQKRFLSLPAPALSDQASDLDRFRRALPDLELDVPLPVLRALPDALRTADFEVTAVIVGNHLVEVEPGDTTGESYGLALDLGTTTVSAALVDLRTGAIAGLATRPNGQERFGSDVISRISRAALGPEMLAELSAAAHATVEEVLVAVCHERGVARERIYHAEVVGNSTMLHLLLGVDPEALSVAPFPPAFAEPLDLAATDAGLAIHPNGRVQTFPLIGAYVGADIVAGVLASGIGRKGGLSLLVDIGTNGEIVLGSGERVLAAAAPAGPAFEGAEIRHGMRAVDGAIDAVRLGETVELNVLGDATPRGICGSGLVDTVAELLRVGLLEPSGRLRRRTEAPEHPLADRLIVIDGAPAFLLADGVELTQRDIRELQSAKGATAAGIRILLAEFGVDPDDLSEILLAGSFGTYIDPVSAQAIGLVPAVEPALVASVGNSALEGAKMALLSFREQQLGVSLRTRIEYLELSSRRDFNDAFVGSLEFPAQARSDDAKEL